jgi:zinc transporter 1/2/3
LANSTLETFEGLALGSRIAAVKWEKKTIQPWLMALAYGCTYVNPLALMPHWQRLTLSPPRTPLGQAIGLATHTLYSPDSEVGLILVGVMNAISAGLLTFASLVELLSEDFLSDASWRYLRGKQRIGACLLVFLGAFGMSLVGAWA